MKLNNLVQQLEMKNEELIQQEKLQGPRSFIIFNNGGYSNTGLFDDMDTSDSKSDCDSETLDVGRVQSRKVLKKKKGSRKGSSLEAVSNPIDLATSVGLFTNSTVGNCEFPSICMFQHIQMRSKRVEVVVSMSMLNRLQVMVQTYYKVH